MVLLRSVGVGCGSRSGWRVGWRCLAVAVDYSRSGGAAGGPSAAAHSGFAALAITDSLEQIVGGMEQGIGTRDLIAEVIHLADDIERSFRG